jgi:hypothetical protein
MEYSMSSLVALKDNETPSGIDITVTPKTSQVNQLAACPM